MAIILITRFTPRFITFPVTVYESIRDYIFSEFNHMIHVNAYLESVLCCLCLCILTSSALDCTAPPLITNNWMQLHLALMVPVSIMMLWEPV